MALFFLSCIYKNGGTGSPGGRAGQMGAGEKTCFWGSPVPVPGQEWRCSGEMCCGVFLMELLPTAASTRKWPLNGDSEICSRTFLFLGIGEGSFPTASLPEVGHGSPPWHSCIASTEFSGIWVCQWGMGVWGPCLTHPAFPAPQRGNVPVSHTRGKCAGVETTFPHEPGSLTGAVQRFYFSPQDWIWDLIFIFAVN